MAVSLDHAPVDLFGYSCPWCPVVVVDAGLTPAVQVFEWHVDQHFAAGDHLNGLHVPAQRQASR